jgi:hypothetical protein
VAQGPGVLQAATLGVATHFAISVYDALGLPYTAQLNIQVTSTSGLNFSSPAVSGAMYIFTYIPEELGSQKYDLALSPYNTVLLEFVNVFVEGMNVLHLSPYHYTYLNI